MTPTWIPANVGAAVKAGFTVLALGFAAWLLAAQGPAIRDAIRGADPLLLGIALLAACANLVMAALSWRCLVPRELGPLGLASSARIFFLSQLGKYVPGGVWNFVAASELGRAAGFARAPILASFVLALLIGAASGLALTLPLAPQAFAGFAMPTWLSLALLAATAGIFLARPVLQRALAGRLAGLNAPAAPMLITSALLALAGWLAAGIMVGALLIALGTEPALSLFITATGAYAFAWIAGFAVFVAPAGIAVREAALIAVLATQADLAQASAAAILARAAVTAADLLAGLAAALIPSDRSARTPSAIHERA